MTKEEIRVATPEELLRQYANLTDGKNDHRDPCDEDELAKSELYIIVREELLRRLRPASPLKTEQRTFGELQPGNEFLIADGSRNRFVTGRGNYAALPLDGPSKDILWWPGPSCPVEKILD